LKLSFITYNIWNTERWDVRERALRKFLEVFEPDVLCLQELRRRSRDLIDATLATHDRVKDRFAGWTRESNIYWRRTLLSEVEHGAEDVKITEAGHRRLFWARLQRTDAQGTILVATAHLTHQRHPAESATGLSPRIGETRLIIDALKRLAGRREPVFFMGDLNDPVHPIALLQDAGYVSCFAALGLQPAPTFKCYPTANVAPGRLPMTQCVDWITANGYARAVAAATPQFFFKDAAPSDHWPVQAVYELEA
jgi:endonuclease/exonuclease/phosphatase family metal-dependent hydrolase